MVTNRTADLHTSRTGISTTVSTGGSHLTTSHHKQDGKTGDRDSIVIDTWWSGEDYSVKMTAKQHTTPQILVR